MNLILNRSLKQLLWIGIGSIIMFFAGLTSAYVVRKPQGNWIEFLLPDWFLFSTITIIISSVILIIAKRRISHSNEAFFLVFGTRREFYQKGEVVFVVQFFHCLFFLFCWIRASFQLLLSSLLF